MMKDLLLKRLIKSKESKENLGFPYKPFLIKKNDDKICFPYKPFLIKKNDDKIGFPNKKIDDKICLFL